MAQISLRKLNKIYGGGSHAVRDLSLEINDGDFTVLVGPSGCGKSTLLRMIAGLEEISFGELYIDGVLVNEMPPKDRGIAMVFQNYALFPHMTVFDNIAFGLKIKKTDREEIKQRVEEAAEILGVTNLLTRKPAQLSGGQKQRVALGRALVSKPRIFLLDEPLSNLDAKLRASMRSELIKLHRRLNATFIYVTHDQTEALTMGTKIVALKDGVLQQADSPRQIYSYPVNLFTATFIGSPQMNIFPVELKADKNLYVELNGARVDLPLEIRSRLVDESYIGKTINFGIRHERMHIEDDGAISAEVVFYEPLGGSGMVGLNIDGVTANVDVVGKTVYTEDQMVKVNIETARVHMFDLDTGEALLIAPKYNYLKATVETADGKLNVIAGGNRFVLDKYEHVVDEAALNGDVLFALGNKTKEDGDIAVELKIDFVSTQQDKVVVYGTTTVTGERVIFECVKTCSYMVGDTETVRFASSDCTLADADRNRLLSLYPSRGKVRTLYVKQKGRKVATETLKILADERFNDGWLLYCGTDDDYVVVKAPEDYPVYGKYTIKVEAVAAA